jgi:hypothetical protein
MLAGGWSEHAYRVVGPELICAGASAALLVEREGKAYRVEVREGSS